MADMDLDDEASMLAINTELERYRVKSTKPSQILGPDDQLGTMLIDSTDLPKISVLFVLDTNYLLSHLNLLSELFKILPHSNAFIIPWVVVQELDGLKRSNDSYVNGKSVGYLAREATRILLDALQRKTSIIRGQKMNESIVTCSENDDRIMDCCLYFKQHYCPHVVLLTSDVNLGLKSTIHDILCFNEHCDTVEDFFHKINQRFRQPTSSLYLQPRQHEPHHYVPSDEEMHDAQYLVSPSHSKPAFDITTLPLHDIIACSLIDYLTTYVPPFLHRHLADEYGADIYLDVISYKPPWTALSLIQCIRQHVKLNKSSESTGWAKVEKWVREWVRRGGKLSSSTGENALILIKPGHPKYIPWRVDEIESILQDIEEALALFCRDEPVEDRVQRQLRFKAWREKVNSNKI